MTTTITVTTKRQVVLPKVLCEHKHIGPGTSLRVTEVGDGFYITPIPDPTADELRAVLAAAGSLTRRQTAGDLKRVRRAIAQYRSQKRPRRG